MRLISSSYVRFYRILCLLFALHFRNLSIDSKKYKLFLTQNNPIKKLALAARYHR